MSAAEELRRRISTQVGREAYAAVEILKEAVSIPSISLIGKHRKDCLKMADWLIKLVRDNGGTAKAVKTGYQGTQGKNHCQLPPVILADFEAEGGSEKPTLLIYSHYDVAPVTEEQCWSSSPFTLKESRDGRMFGRGVSASKGPLIACILAASMFKKLGKAIPINIKFIVEGMAESASECLHELATHEAQAGGFLSSVDFACLPNFSWIDSSCPTIPVATSGALNMSLAVSSCSRDLKAAEFSGAVHEPLVELSKILGCLVDSQGRVLIGHAKQTPSALVQAAHKEVDQSKMDLDAWKRCGGGLKHLKGENNELELRLNQVYRSVLSIHSIETNGSVLKASNFIPRKATAKAVLRLAPGQDPDRVGILVGETMQKTFNRMESPNNFELCITLHPEYNVNTKGALFQAATRTAKKVYHKRPHKVRLGNSTDISCLLEDVLQADVTYIPLGGPGDNVHGIDENMEKSQFLSAIVYMTNLFEELSKTPIQKTAAPPSHSDEELSSYSLLSRISNLIA
eukprot:CAMPEP_0198729192 /NCGR_PEP_ID=MMETSP1475-20131203/15529_1 /TAXON_ID= ORGANISM="Unidentified sp., Strain CCMP1999" /NCGR_SAMPLE_ID=MMETSP1475 /ASSEMBLY_ACC=CAM_ASM_001111 /LENGTH=513 /DNA_ID=CAMNT_0044491773 /DNA_START=12 /DNA_END=1549 /DNA_ORIENTATION=-